MVDVMSVAEAAAELGVTERRIRALCGQGRIEGARRPGRDWVIPRPVRIRPGRRGPKGLAERGGGAKEQDSEGMGVLL